MRKLALLGALVLGAVAVLSTPPAHAQARCRSNTALCLGDKNTKTVIGGNLAVQSPDGGFAIGETGAVTAPSLSVAGAVTLSGTVATVKAGAVDAGVLLVNNAFQLAAPITCGGAAACGSITLSSGSPSTGTATVPAGVVCSCFPVGTTAAIAAGGCAANVSSTTLTVTGPNTVTTVMRYVCWL